MSERDTLFEQRARKAAELRALGHNPYANDFRVDTRVADFVRQHHGAAAAALEASPARHAVAGRVMAINSFGKAAFIRIQDASCGEVVVGTEAVGRLQIYVRRDRIGEAAWEAFSRLDLGDFVGVHGGPMRTKTDELSLGADNFRLLTKALRPLPEKWHGLQDVETRYRQRYLDLVANPDVRQTFVTRSRITDWLRRFLIDRGFLEVETPMMQAVPGGAAARPFVTHHNALGLDLYLRVAPELFLKRLVVGGFEQVFEINRNFRNEGISAFHNPEFTMLEFYQAYATYEDMMALAEAMLGGVAAALGRQRLTWDGHDIALSPPFARHTMLEAIALHGGPSAAVARQPQQAAAVLEGEGVSTRGLDEAQLVVALFEHFAEKKLIQPTFITDFPAAVSPLSRRREGDPWFVDRFELFVAGHELANAFSELNDPVDQAGRFAAQAAARSAGDPEAHGADDDYVRALEHGMPPTGGFGMGIDRLVMLLCGQTSIRDVVLFPQLRPER